MKHKKPLVLVALVLLFALLVGCAPVSFASYLFYDFPPATSRDGQVGEKVNGYWTSFQVEDYYFTDKFQEKLADFEMKYLMVTIKETNISYDTFSTYGTDYFLDGVGLDYYLFPLLEDDGYTYENQRKQEGQLKSGEEQTVQLLFLVPKDLTSLVFIHAEHPSQFKRIFYKVPLEDDGTRK